MTRLLAAVIMDTYLFNDVDHAILGMLNAVLRLFCTGDVIRRLLTVPTMGTALANDVNNVIL